MEGITFSHPSVGTLHLRFAPKEVNWSYNLNTSETNTYAGQVVQILSVNFESLTITGQFGNESKDDYNLSGIAWTRKAPAMANRFGRFGPGLAQMTEWFKGYFAVASQGVGTDNYNEQPITIQYAYASDIAVDEKMSESKWLVYPTSFPSYRIANDNFAPEWKVECQVYQAPDVLVDQAKQESIERLAYEPLYQPGSKFSDPVPVINGAKMTPEELKKAAKDAYQALYDNTDRFWQQLPAYTEEDILSLLKNGFSAPATVPSTPINKSKELQPVRKVGDPFSQGFIPEGTSMDGRIP